MTTTNKHVGSTLESLFEERGEGADFRLLTLKKVLADELAEAMAAAGMNRASLAAAMKTSRTVAYRLLDPNDTGVTLDTLVRASDALGLDVGVSLRVRKAKPHRRSARVAVKTARASARERPRAR